MISVAKQLKSDRFRMFMRVIGVMNQHIPIVVYQVKASNFSIILSNLPLAAL